MHIFEFWIVDKCLHVNNFIYLHYIYIYIFFLETRNLDIDHKFLVYIIGVFFLNVFLLIKLKLWIIFEDMSV